MQKRSKRAGGTNDEQNVISNKDSGKGIRVYYIFRAISPHEPITEQGCMSLKIPRTDRGKKLSSITALLSVAGDTNNHNLQQSGRLLYCVHRRFQRFILPYLTGTLYSLKTRPTIALYPSLTLIATGPTPDHTDHFYQPFLSSCRLNVRVWK